MSAVAAANTGTSAARSSGPAAAVRRASRNVTATTTQMTRASGPGTKTASTPAGCRSTTANTFVGHRGAQVAHGDGSGNARLNGIVGRYRTATSAAAETASARSERRSRWPAGNARTTYTTPGINSHVAMRPVL